MPEYVSATEASDLLGCSESFIRKRIKSGDLPATKVDGRWSIARADLEDVSVGAPVRTAHADEASIRSARTDRPHVRTARADEASVRTAHANRTDELHEWRADLLAQVARLEADKIEAGRREREAGQREERSKARIIDLERAATVRESRITDLEETIGVRESRIADLSEQVAVLEAKVREVLEDRAEDSRRQAVENGQLANRIADLVDRQQEAAARIHELQPVAERVPMLQAAVEQKDATLDAMQRDIEAIAGRPVAGPVFRYLTRGKLRR